MMRSRQTRMKLNELNPIVVLSPGRTGSTLLQRYLNLSEEIVIWGEHGGFISGLLKLYMDFLENQKAQKNIQSGLRNVDVILKSQPITQRGIEWTNNFTNQDFSNRIREFIYNLLSNGVDIEQRWGFKEIRYHEKEIKFIKHLFPDVQFIFILRDPLDTISSMIGAWEKENWERSRSDTNEQFKIFEKYCKRISLSLNSIKSILNQEVSLIIVGYEDLVNHPHESLKEIFLYLGVKIPNRQKINLIANSHLSVTKKNSIKEAIENYYVETSNFKELCFEYEKVNFLKKG